MVDSNSGPSKERRTIEDHLCASMCICGSILLGGISTERKTGTTDTHRYTQIFFARVDHRPVTIVSASSMNDWNRSMCFRTDSQINSSGVDQEILTIDRWHEQSAQDA